MAGYPIYIFVDDKPVMIPNESEWYDFKAGYDTIHAAGGLVFDAKKEILMIYRLRRWDFPKGKVEEGESFEQAALREVGEETGISSLSIERSLPETYHTYSLNSRNILKITHWYLMYCSSNSAPVPQTGEDISQVVWIGYEKVGEKLSDSYNSLKMLWNSVESIFH